ncbi:AAA family ATPase [Actinoallomurus sp. NPDC052274]|uniref:AAA family ATPase n=1 Tax=Actinoallomurus sp. NPDC052274 TaxID=3155420 RepID=UPI00342544BF
MTERPRSTSRYEFVSRKAELSAVQRLLRATQAGRGGTLVIYGEAGIGKTELLEHALTTVPGLDQIRVTGRQFEAELPFTALHELCRPMLTRLEALPDPQRAALEVALALRDGTAPDTVRVGLAVLGLLSDAAREQPIVCVVDDAQWVDQASAEILTFVARRVEREPVAFLITMREDPSGCKALEGFPAQLLGGLGNDDALALLGSLLHTPLDRRVRDQIIAEARGNPLALLELPRLAEPAALAGGFGLPDAVPVPERIEAGYRGRLAGFPAETRTLLLIAAAESLGEPTLLWRAAERLGIHADAAAPAEADGLLDLGVRVRFRHPLVRSAVYRAASPGDRRAVHRALADVTDPLVDPDRRAWHRAMSVLVPDEAIAEDLERSADRACARGGVAAAARFLERAVALTPDPPRRAARALAAARFKHRAGDAEAATGLLATALAGPLDGERHALAELLSAQIADHGRREGRAASRLLEAARRLETYDRPLARQAYLEAIAATLRAGRLGEGGLLPKISRAALAAAGPEPPRPLDLLLEALSTQAIDGYAAALPSLRRAVRSFLDDTSEQERDAHWLWLACGVAIDLCDDEEWLAITERQVRQARRWGALLVLPSALRNLALVRAHTGDFHQAAALLDEADAIPEHNLMDSWLKPLLPAWRGDTEQVSSLIETIARLAREYPLGILLTVADYATAVLNNGIGRYDAALQAARTAYRHEMFAFHSLIAPELIEAAARAGHPRLAEPTLERLIERTDAVGTDWALGVQLRSRALLSEGPEAEGLYQEAIDRLRRTRLKPHLARAHLIYGEWLRRQARRADARSQLRIAFEELSAMGADGFAARAAREMAACGDRPRKPTGDPLDGLTAQERQIALLVAQGATSKEAAGQLFISPRTVEAHLRNIFSKLGLTSRRQLRDLRLHGSAVQSTGRPSSK